MGEQERGQQDMGVAATPPGSQASPEAAEASSPSVSIPNAVTPLTKAELYAGREALLAIFRAAISVAYARQVRRGYTIEVMAKRIGWKPAKMADLILVPQGIKLDQIAEICAAMDCEPGFDSDERGRILVSVTPYASGIEAQRAETGTGSVHESPVAKPDAPNPLVSHD